MISEDLQDHFSPVSKVDLKQISLQPTLLYVNFISFTISISLKENLSFNSCSKHFVSIIRHLINMNNINQYKLSHINILYYQHSVYIICEW